MARRDADEDVIPFWGAYTTAEGNIGRVPEDRSREGDGSFVTFSIAVNNRKSDGTEGTIWYDVVCRGSLAENVLASDLSTRSRVIVHGRLEDATWTNKDDEEVAKQQIIADMVGASFRWSAYEALAKDDKGNKSSRGRGRGRDRDEEDDEDEDEEESPRSRRSSRGSSREETSSRRGRSSARDEDSGRSSSRGSRRGGRAANRGDEDEEDWGDEN